MASNQGSLGQMLAQAVAPLTGTGSLVGEVDRLTAQLQRLQTVNEAALDSMRSNTQAVQTSTSTQSGASSGRSVASTALSVLGGGLGISPLISGVLRLFGGGGSSNQPAPLPKFALPSALNVDAGVSSGALGSFGVDYGQGNVLRPVMQATPQITVNVSAMDSQSFLDRSNDIALAVRQAMLESSVLNDVVREA